MILVDANILIYAHVSNMEQHQRSKEWLDQMFNGPAPVGLPWPSLLSFLRLVSNPRVFEKPESIQQAWVQVEAWLNAPRAWIPYPTERHLKVLAKFIPFTKGKPNLIPDAHLATLAVEHGLILCSADNDFAHFEGLRWENPIASRGLE